MTPWRWASPKTVQSLNACMNFKSEMRAAKAMLSQSNGLLSAAGDFGGFWGKYVEFGGLGTNMACDTVLRLTPSFSAAFPLLSFSGDFATRGDCAPTQSLSIFQSRRSLENRQK